MNLGQDAVSRSKNTGWAFLMMFLGVGIGWGLYRTFSPGERARRIRVADAKDHAREVRKACRQQINKATADIDRIRRGEVVALTPLVPCVVGPVVKGKSSDNGDDIEEIE